MNERDEELLKSMRDTLGLKNRFYNYRHSAKSIGRGRMVMLIVRDFPQIKTIIIPFFYGKLYGNKGKQFYEWLEKMGDDNMSESAKFLYRLYKRDQFEKYKNSWV
ncbi:MAG: hypothetical protein UT32_C0041G0006 [Parcubacteria group bacterium GW2011_GWC2_39_14]|nr:MAG: hypothetical protein UT32_C0041G0006 [Parcubacteria group bacterium GW2011_GWC2_39_14]